MSFSGISNNYASGCGHYSAPVQESDSSKTIITIGLVALAIILSLTNIITSGSVPFGVTIALGIGGVLAAVAARIVAMSDNHHY